MANPKIEFRLPPIMHAYLEDLAKLGAYGQGRNGVAKRFAEDGIKAALAQGVLGQKTVEEFEDNDDEEEN